MRVLHIESGRHFYGGARQVAYLIRGLAARGIENLLACVAEQPLAAADLPAEIIHVPMRGDLDPGLTRRLVRLIDETGADLVHGHSRRGADLGAGRASRATGRPAVLTRRVESREPAAWLRHKLAPYRRVVAISRAIEAELVTVCGAAGPGVELIPSAVDTGLFRPDPQARTRLLVRHGLDDGALLVGFAAQLIPRKGHRFFFDCMVELAARIPELKLLLFGRGPLEGPLRRRVRAAGLESEIRFCGFEPDLPGVLPGLDLLVHPAEREGLGAVLLESMSAGVVVLASGVGGIVDVVDSGTDGILLPPRDRSAWISAVEYLARDAAARARLAGAGRHKVERLFTIDAMCDRYLEVYRDVCS